jgi:hypothetical protein
MTHRALDYLANFVVGGAFSLMFFGDVLAEPTVFATARSAYCGVEQCEEVPVYLACRHSDCGASSTMEDCGQHWTDWHGVGGGHGNPCPSACTRIGGALGYRYRTVDFPPKPQESNLYQCQRSVVETRQCATAACGIAAYRKTGNVLVYRMCEHPRHGLDLKEWEVEHVSASEARREQLLMASKLSQLFEAHPTLSIEHDFNEVGAVLAAYLQVAKKSQEENKPRIGELRVLLDTLGVDLSLEVLASVLGEKGLAQLRSADSGRKGVRCIAGQ